MYSNSVKDHETFLTLGVLSFMFGFVGKGQFGLSYTAIGMIALIIGGIISWFASNFGIEQIHHTYQAGRRDPRTGEVETIRMDHPIHKSWWTPILEVQIVFMPMFSLFGAAMGLLFMSVK